MNFAKEEECLKSRACIFYKDRFYWKNNHLKWNNFLQVITTHIIKPNGPKVGLEFYSMQEEPKKKMKVDENEVILNHISKQTARNLYRDVISQSS